MIDEMADLVHAKQRQAAALNVDDCPECKANEIVPYVGGKSYAIEPCLYHKELVCKCGCGGIGFCGVDEKAEAHNDDRAIGIFDRDEL